MLLTELKPKEVARIVELTGGEKSIHKLESLGVREGKKVTMMSSHFWHGPVTVMVDKIKIAIGHGMAKKIIVEKDEE